MTDEDRKSILAQNASLAQRALRVLAAASRDLEPVCEPSNAGSVERDLVFLGLAGMTDRGFVVLMIATGLLTSGVALAVYLYSLGRVSQEMARDHAFTALVYAELLRSFGARSETRLVWQVGILSNLKLALVVLASMALTFWAPHNAWLGAFLEVEPMPMYHCLVLLAVGAIPLLALEGWKLMRRAKELA